MNTLQGNWTKWCKDLKITNGLSFSIAIWYFKFLIFLVLSWKLCNKDHIALRGFLASVQVPWYVKLQIFDKKKSDVGCPENFYKIQWNLGFCLIKQIKAPFEIFLLAETPFNRMRLMNFFGHYFCRKSAK